MTLAVREIPRHGWDPLPGSVGVVGRVLVRERFTSVGGEVAGIREQQVRWPKDVPHRLWTEGTTMTTLMIEGASVDFGS